MAPSRPYRLAIEAGLLALVAGLAAFGVSAATRLAAEAPLPPPEPVRAPAAAGTEPLEAYAAIAARDLFNAEPPARRARGPVLRLWGVGMLGGDARAVIEDAATGRQDLYRVGDVVADARVAAIGWDRVTLARAGVEEVLELAEPEAERTEPAAAPAATEPSPGIRRTGPGAFVVDRRELAGAADTMSGLMTQLRAVAEVEEGRPAGFRLFQIRDDSLFRRLGIENGDVVRRVNGQPVADPSTLLALLQRLRTEPRVAVDIVRGGVARTLVYDLR
jgi:general secretion pathway protein C